MSRKIALLLPCAILAGGLLHAESSDYPLAINLPTSERMQYWDIGVGFTHRFVTPTQGHSKDMFGLDGYAYPGFGFDFGIKAIPGLNVLIYRTADNKTFTFALQEELLNKDLIRMALKVERFDEAVQKNITPLGTVGISGAAVQLPTDIFITDDIIFSLVPTYLSRTTTQEKSIFNVGVGLRIGFTEKFSFMSEFYPRPSKVSQAWKKLDQQGLTGNNQEPSAGFSAGFSYKTFKHRFTLIGTNTTGTTANQVLSGDYGGGPRAHGQWSLGFNVTRVF